jgi:hypothetical protein
VSIIEERAMEKISETMLAGLAIPDPKRPCEDSGFETAITKAFNIAIILTGSTELAEYAVAEAIRVWDETEPPEQMLYLGAIVASIEVQKLSNTNRPPESDSTASRLPLRLRNVVRLMPAIRNCFVLRVLLGLSYETCACLLHSSAGQVVANTYVALQKLAELDITYDKRAAIS